jgi:tetrahydromethanopterin S-methyltransferase subunit B
MSPKPEQSQNLLMLASLATRLYETENSMEKPKMMSFKTFRKKDFTCELCGFEPKTKNKYREKQDHLMNRHFKKQIDLLMVNNTHKKCPTCDYEAGDRQSLLRHYTAKHGILEKLLSEALEEQNIDDEMKVENNRGTKRKLGNDVSAEEEKISTPKKLALTTLSNNNFPPKVLSTNSKILPKPVTILPQNTIVPLVVLQTANADIPRKILPAVPNFTIKPLVPVISTKETLSPKLKFQCQQCLKPFINNRDLTRHAVVHTQEKNFRCSFCNAAFFGRKDHLFRHEQNCNNNKISIQSKLMSPGSAVQSVIRIRPLNQLMPSPPTSVADAEEEPIEEFNHPISDDPYIPTILDPTYYPVKEPEVELVISEKTAEIIHIEEKSIPIDQQEIMENAVELEHIPTNSEWSGNTRIHSLIPTIIVDDYDNAEKEMEIAGIDENLDQEQPTNLVIGEDENEDLELVIDEDFSSDVMVEDDQNDIIDDEEVNERNNICLHIPLKKRGKFSCINCSLQRA